MSMPQTGRGRVRVICMLAPLLCVSPKKKRVLPKKNPLQVLP